MASDDTTHAYVGRLSCGCIRFVVVDRLDVLLDDAKEIREAQKAGMVFSRVTLHEARTAKWDCGTPDCTRKS